jgi:hypothetical protein
MSAAPAEASRRVWWPAPRPDDRPLDLDDVAAQLGTRQFRQALERQFMRARVDPDAEALATGTEPPLVTEYPKQAAAVVMALIGAILDTVPE